MSAEEGINQKAESLYRDIILDHYREKHHSGLREPCEAEVYHTNSSCGDEVTLRVHLDQDIIADVSYEAVACSISQASCSIMADLVIGKRIDQALELYDDFRAMLEHNYTQPDEDRLEDAIAFAGVAQFPARVKCALLAWAALKDALVRAIANSDSVVNLTGTR